MEPADAAETADVVLICPRVRQIARRLGYQATFHVTAQARDGLAGWHLHQVAHTNPHRAAELHAGPDEDGSSPRPGAPTWKDCCGSARRHGVRHTDCQRGTALPAAFAGPDRIAWGIDNKAPGPRGGGPGNPGTGWRTAPANRPRTRIST